jgi:DNA-binding GntR family transcriptional regulator
VASREHQAVLDAIYQGDAGAAGRLLGAHLAYRAVMPSYTG